MTKQSDLWQFANGFYAAPDAATQLLALQNDHQMNVNHLIYALWLSTIDYQLVSLPNVDEGAGAWRSEICLPLRTLRFALRRSKAEMTQKLDAVEACYQQMLAAELAAERVELDMLATDIEKYAQLNIEKYSVDKLIKINVIACCSDEAYLAQAIAMKEALDQYIQLAIKYVMH
jgi:uncharacterized protein (TIGR02444 family)